MRVRRKVMEVLKHLSKHLPSTLEAEVIIALLQRTVDQDADVRKAAYQCFDSIPVSNLLSKLTTVQWRQLLEDGFGVASINIGGGQATNNQIREIQTVSNKLLARYIRQDGEEVENAAIQRLYELLSAGELSGEKSGTGGLGAGIVVALSGIFTENDLMQE